jgi:hypothetical protein
MIVDPGQYDIAESLKQRLGDLWESLDDPSADAQFDSLLENPAMKTFLGPRMATHGIDSPRVYFGDMRRYNCVEQAPKITSPSYVTDNETDPVSTGQGEELFNALTCPKEFRRFLQKEGAEGNCEGTAPAVFWTAAFDRLESTLV